MDTPRLSSHNASRPSLYVRHEGLSVPFDPVLVAVGAYIVRRLSSTVYAALFVLLSRWGVLLLFPESDARLNGVIVFVMLGAALYEFLTRQFVTRRLRQDAPAPTWLWYLNALLETSIPTLAFFMIGFGQAVPVSYLVSSFIMLYAVFIVLSTLRLDIRDVFSLRRESAYVEQSQREGTMRNFRLPSMR